MKGADVKLNPAANECWSSGITGVQRVCGTLCSDIFVSVKANLRKALPDIPSGSRDLRAPRI